MLGHYDVTGDEEFVAGAHRFQRALEEASCGVSFEVGEPVVAGEGDEVEVAGPLNPDEAFWYGGMVHPGIRIGDVTARTFGVVLPTSQKRDVGHPLSWRLVKKWATGQNDKQKRCGRFTFPPFPQRRGKDGAPGTSIAKTA